MSPSVGTLEEFGAAIDGFPSGDDFEPVWSAGARQSARRSLRQHGLCLVGEVHGVAENALVIEHLVAELGVEVVALEWPEGLERAVDDLAWLADGASFVGYARDASPANLAAGVAWFGDGRITAGHFAVLRRMNVRVVAVDEASSFGPDARDAAMARNVESVVRSGSGGVLFVAGNLHTQLRPHPHYRAAGVHLASARPDLSALDMHYARGRFWNCGPRTFHDSAPPTGPHVLVHDATEAVVLAAS